MSFPKAQQYLQSIDLESACKLDRLTYKLLNDPESYERASQALRRRFVRGAVEVEAVDRGERFTKIRRERHGGSYKYFVRGADGKWIEPEERIWVVAMYALWQDLK